MPLRGPLSPVPLTLRKASVVVILLASSTVSWADQSASHPDGSLQTDQKVNLRPGGKSEAPVHENVVANPVLDRSGHKRRGKASFYAREFSGRKMADGTIMRPHSDNAASKTLPLGTTAKVTNLRTGQSAVVTIRDRGPYIRDRIVDLSPSTANDIGIDRQNGVAKVEVAPIEVPLADGGVKLGAAVTDAGKAPSNN
jgi:rare lipoprotein A (peptidoglycan hydrolase)